MDDDRMTWSRALRRIVNCVPSDFNLPFSAIDSRVVDTSFAFSSTSIGSLAIFASSSPAFRLSTPHNLMRKWDARTNRSELRASYRLLRDDGT